MSAVILPFAPVTRRAAQRAEIAKPVLINRAWADQHLPLIERPRWSCSPPTMPSSRTVAAGFEQEEGRVAVETLSTQLDRLGERIGDVVGRSA